MNNDEIKKNTIKNIVKAEKINKSFQSGRGVLEVLKGASIELHEGEIVLLLGASGSGKSTLLHILGTLDKPDSGSILYDEVDVNALKHNALAKFRNEKIGFVYQFHHLLPDFNALENVMLPINNGLPRENAAEKALELLKAVGLEDRDTHKPNQLSGGEAQRVAVPEHYLINLRSYMPMNLLGTWTTKPVRLCWSYFWNLTKGSARLFL
jgi:lipoprotein-releasing system ATP-binding protein